MWTFRLWSTSSLLLLIDLYNCHCQIRGGYLIWKIRSLWRFVIVYIQRRHNERLIWQIACRSALLQHGVLTLELTRFPADLGRSLSFYVFYFVQFVAKNEAFNDRYFAAFKGLVELLLQFVLFYDAFEVSARILLNHKNTFRVFSNKFAFLRGFFSLLIWIFKTTFFFIWLLYSLSKFQYILINADWRCL